MSDLDQPACGTRVGVRRLVFVAVFLGGALTGVAVTLAVIGSVGGVEPAGREVAEEKATKSAVRGTSVAVGGERGVEPNGESVGRGRAGGKPAAEKSATPELAAEERFLAALALGDVVERRSELRSVLKTWVGEDHEAALAMVEGIGNLALRRELLQFSLTTLSDDSPATAVALLKTMPSLQHDQLWERSFLSWVATDPTTAIEAWEGHRHPEERREALKGIAVGLAAKDTDAALEWANGLSDQKEKREAVHQIVGRAMKSGYAHAARHLDALAAVDQRAAVDFADVIAQRWAEQDADAAIEWADSLEFDQRNRALREIAHKMVHRDPEVAEALISRIHDRGLREGLIADLGRLRMTAGVEEVEKWIRELPPEDQQAAWKGASVEWARSKPQDVAAFALSGAVDAPVREQLIELALPHWARANPAAAAAWAERLPAGSADGALERVVHEWSSSDPVATLDFLATRVDGGQFEQLAQRALRNWSHADPAKAAAFVGGLETGAMKDRIAGEVTKTWMERDSIAASEWVAALEPGPARDSAVLVLINHIERDDVAAAADWAETIDDTAKRDDAFERLLRRLEGGS